MSAGRGGAAHLVVMGVSGSGKSTVGAALAARLGVPFADADDFHPEANVALMAAGTPLTDAHRWPWLDTLVAWMAERAGDEVENEGEVTPIRSVVACSALRRAYRDVLRTAPGGAAHVLLEVDDAEVRRRVAARSDHFMPVTLLDSQLATLEPLTDDEHGLTLTAGAGADVEAIVEEVVRRWRLGEGGA